MGTPLPATTARAIFDIPSIPLSDALRLFAQQSGRELLFSSVDVLGRLSVPVHGRLDPDRVLQQLLSGTGYRAKRAPGGAYLLVADPLSRSAHASLGPVVTDRPTDAATTTPDIVVVGTPGGGQSRQEASFAVTRINRDQIDQLSPASTADILRLVPGLSIETSGGKNGANIFVRGYPSSGDAEYVTFQTEGVPFFPPATLSFLENSQLIRIDETIERVEAVRGGTGALFASGQPGVTVNFVQREGGSKSRGLIKSGVTDDGEVRIDALLSGPVTSTTRFMIGGYYSKGNGRRSPDFDADRGGQITANLRQDLTHGSLLFFARYLNDRSQWLLPIPVEQRGQHISSFPGFDAGTATLLGLDTRRGTLPDGAQYDLNDGRGARIANLGANLDDELGAGFTVRERLSWLAGDANTIGLVPGAIPPRQAAAYASDLGGSIASLTTVGQSSPISPNQDIVEAGIWSVRKRIEAFVNDASLEWKGGPNTLTAGVYTTVYSSQDSWNLGNTLLLTAEPHARRLNMTLTNGALVTHNGFASGSTFDVDGRYSGGDVAVYVVDEWNANPSLRLDGGMRYQYHSVHGTVRDSHLVDPNGPDGNPLTLYDNSDVALNASARPIRYRDGAWSWTAGINQDLTPIFGLFGRYSRGHTFPFFDNLRDGITVAPRVDTFEAGLKLSTRRASLYTTLFHNRFQGLATTVITNGAPIASIGGARATGLEAEGVLRPSRSLSIAVSGTWLDAHYHHFSTDNGSIDLSGRRVQRQPVWQWRLTPSYGRSLGTHLATAYLTISYVGDRWSDVQNAQRLPHYVTLDTGATVDFGERWRLQAVVTNLTDTIGLTEGNPRTIGAQETGAIFARPILGRSVQLSARYEFGP